MFNRFLTASLLSASSAFGINSVSAAVIDVNADTFTYLHSSAGNSDSGGYWQGTGLAMGASGDGAIDDVELSAGVQRAQTDGSNPNKFGYVVFSDAPDKTGSITFKFGTNSPSRTFDTFNVIGGEFNGADSDKGLLSLIFAGAGANSTIVAQYSVNDGVSWIQFDDTLDNADPAQSVAQISSVELTAAELNGTSSVWVRYQGTFTAGNPDVNMQLARPHEGVSDAIVFTPDFTNAFEVSGTTVVPEPGSIALLGLGGLLVAVRRRK